MREIYLEDLWTNDQRGTNFRSGIAITSFPCVIGRHRACACRLESPRVSRLHCKLSLQGDQICVQDLGSLNGTFVNGQLVQGAQPLHEGDLLQVACRTFQVRLPARPTAPVVNPDAAREVTELAGEPLHVLVVEDNDDAAEMLAQLLTAWGHKVDVAHDGPEAIQAAQAHPPDTVLLDICLPGMDGYQVAMRLREEARLEKARLVGITGYEQEDRGRFEAVGLAEVLTKPVDPAVLQGLIGHTK
jgi:CheY-like chemotaxis protein